MPKGEPRFDCPKPEEQRGKPYGDEKSMREYNRELMDKLEKFIAQDSNSQESAARLIGVSGAALSNYRKEKYMGNIDNLEEKIEYFFDQLEAKAIRDEKQAPYLTRQDYVPTSVSEDVYQAIKYCQLEKGIVIIHGDAGIGKTKAAERFVQENKSVSIYIQAAPCCGTVASFLRLLARSLRMPEGYTTPELSRQIRRRLAGTDMVMIIDEAQHLHHRTLEELRTMSDPNGIVGDRGIGIALIGNTEVYDRMLSRQEARFAQLFSRVRLNRSYTTLNITGEDVAKLFPLLTERKMQKELDFMLGVCQSKWGVRGATNVYTNAANNEDVSYNGLLGIARAMGIGLMV